MRNAFIKMWFPLSSERIDAGNFRRMVGASVDIGLFIPSIFLILGFFEAIHSLGLGFVLEILYGWGSVLGASQKVIDGIFILPPLIWFVWWWMDGWVHKNNAGSPGQRWVDLKVVNLEGNTPSLQQRIRRFIGRFFYFAPSLIGSLIIQEVGPSDFTQGLASFLVSINVLIFVLFILCFISKRPLPHEIFSDTHVEYVPPKKFKKSYLDELVENIPSNSEQKIESPTEHKDKEVIVHVEK
ncbi:MAG TPA: RDD family protein [Ignavibacteriaceae bacterium]